MRDKEEEGRRRQYEERHRNSVDPEWWRKVYEEDEIRVPELLYRIVLESMTRPWPRRRKAKRSKR
jgi:hypothetical protein